MPYLVPTTAIEQIVGVSRHQVLHYGISVASEQVTYVLHSQECYERHRTSDYQGCPFSIAQDNGIIREAWAGHEDVPVVLGLFSRDRLRYRLVPMTTTGDWFADPTLTKGPKIEHLVRLAQKPGR
jgi:hypothetical protein